MPKEIWKDIPEFPDYQVSDLGQIRSFKTGRGSRPGPHGYKILKPNRKNTGYTDVCLFRNKKRHYISIHQLVLLAFIGPCPSNMEVMHKNNRKIDNRLENLEYGTRSENRIHDLTTQRTGKQKLRPDDVRFVRKYYIFGHRGKYGSMWLAKKFDVSQCTILAITAGLTWAWLDN